MILMVFISTYFLLPAQGLYRAESKGIMQELAFVSKSLSSGENLESLWSRKKGGDFQVETQCPGEVV